MRNNQYGRRPLTLSHILGVIQTFCTTYGAFDAFAVAVAVMTLVAFPVLDVLRQHLRWNLLTVYQAHFQSHQEGHIPQLCC